MFTQSSQAEPQTETAPAGDESGEPGEPLSGAVETVGDVSMSLWDWGRDIGQAELTVLGATVAGFVVLRLARSFIARLLKGGDRVHDLAWRKIIGRTVNATHGVFLALLALVIAAPYLGLPDPAQAAVSTIFEFAFIVQIALWMRKFALAFIRRQARDTEEGDASTLRNAVSVITILVNVIVWAFAILLVLQNAGIQITPLLAGLGVGGLAIGLAAQGIFSDLFAAFSIIFDKPFEKGDFIGFANGEEGTIEKIGLRTTHIRALSGEQLVYSNTILLEELVRNYRRMSERRIFFGVGVTYQTSPEKAEKVPELMKQAIEAQEQTRFDRAHFIEYGDSSLNYQAVYYVTSPDFVVYRDTHQAILFWLYRKFAEEGIEFAYPTRTLHFSAPDGSGVDPREVASARSELVTKDEAKASKGGKPAPAKTSTPTDDLAGPEGPADGDS